MIAIVAALVGAFACWVVSKVVARDSAARRRRVVLEQAESCMRGYYEFQTESYKRPHLSKLRVHLALNGDDIDDDKLVVLEKWADDAEENLDRECARRRELGL